MNKKRKKLDLSKYTNWFEYLKNSIQKDHDGYKVIFVSDCDGILTDGRSYFTKDEKTHKSYGSYDKEAIRFITDYMNDTLDFITDDKDGIEIHKTRIHHLSDSCKYLSFEIINKSPQERYEYIKYLRNQFKYFRSDVYEYKGVVIVFIGDSISDIPALSEADIAMTTNNAPDEVKEYCNYVSKYNGGVGGYADCIFHFYENFKYVKTILNI